MVTTRHTRGTVRGGKGDGGSNAVNEPSTSSDMQGHAFVPPKKGGRGALRKKKEPSSVEIVDQDVYKVLEAIAGQLKSKGTASSSGSSSWTYASVSEGLKQAVGLLPAGLQQALSPEDSSIFDKHVGVLVELLGGDAGASDAGQERKKQKRERTSTQKGKRRSADESAASELVCDTRLEGLIASWASGKAPRVDTCAAAVMARVPPSDEALRALCETGEMDPRQVLRVCVAVGGLCENLEERVAAFSVFADLLAGGGVAEETVRSAVSSVHAILQGSTGHKNSSVWTMWGEDHKVDAFSKASSACYRLVEAMVAARIGREQVSCVTEENIGDLTRYTVHLMHLLSPYALPGLLLHVYGAKSAGMSDVVMLTAVLAVGGPTEALSRSSIDSADHLSDTTVYLLYLYLARRAIVATHDAALVTLSHQLQQKVGATMPPDSIRAWIEDQPPSSTMQLLIEKSDRGLPEISAYLIEEMQVEDLHALASLSLTGLGEQGGLVEDGQERTAVDDLLFFESTEGALNVFPDDWDDDSDDVEIQIDQGND